MSTSCSWEGKGRYGSFRLRMNVWVYRLSLWDPLRTRAIPERFWGDDSRRGAISSVRQMLPTCLKCEQADTAGRISPLARQKARRGRRNAAHLTFSQWSAAMNVSSHWISACVQIVAAPLWAALRLTHHCIHRELWMVIGQAREDQFNDSESSVGSKTNIVS